MFINPMWDNEAQRIGLQRCTPLGYFFHGVSDLVGLAGLLTLGGSVITIIYRAITGTFQLSLLWYLAAAVGLGFIGMALAAVSWALASRRGFNYDYETRTATWLDQGQIRSLHYSDLVRENR